MGKKLKSLATKMLEEEQGGNGSAQRPVDEEYDPLAGMGMGRRPGSSVFRGPNGMILDQETRAIDELLAGIPKAQGFYLKLLKEIRPGEYEYKIRIDNWEGWSDMQEEIAKIVRGYTEKNKFNQRWGSATYQVLISRAGGVRLDAKRHQPIYFAIDAMEPDAIYPSPITGGGLAAATPSDQIEQLGKLLDIVQKGNPNSQNQSFVETIANLKVDLAKNDSTNNTNMMQTAVQTLSQMLTAQMNKPPEQKESLIRELASLITVLAPTGILEKMLSPNKNQETLVTVLKQAKDIGLIPDKKEDLVETIIKLKAAGIIPDATKVKEVDPIEKTLAIMAQLKQFMPNAAPSSDPLWFKLVDSFAPHALKIGSEIIGMMREKSSRRFVQSGPAVSSTPQFSPMNMRPRIPLAPVEVPPPIQTSSPTSPSSGIFDDTDADIINRQNEYVAQRNAKLQGQEPNIPVDPNEPQIPQDHLQDISTSSRGASVDIPIVDRTPQPQPQPQPTYQPQPQSQERLIMDIFQQMKIARDRNDPNYFPILRDLILQQAGDEMYDSIVDGQIPVMTLFSKVRAFAGPWIDEPRTMQYFQFFLQWARQQRDNEVITFCNRCQEEIVYSTVQDWESSDKKCQVCFSPLALLSAPSQPHVQQPSQQQPASQSTSDRLNVDQLVGTNESGESNIKLPGDN